MPAYGSGLYGAGAYGVGQVTGSGGSGGAVGPVRVSTEVRDFTGALSTPDTILLRVKKPDDTFLPDYTSPVADLTGKYHQDIPASDLTEFGHYPYVWITTGTAAGVSPPAAFEVIDPFTVTVLPLQDAKDQLNIAQSDTRYDAEIQVWIGTIIGGLEKLTGGPLLNRSISEFVKVGHAYRSFAVRQRPLVSVTSVTDNATGTALPVTDLDIDPNSGIVRRKLQLPFWARGPFYTVVYVAGWGVPTPPAFNGAARIILDHLWATQHGPSARPTMAGEETTADFGLGFAVPNRAVELLAPFLSEAYV